MDNKIKTTAEAIENAALSELYSVQIKPDGETVADKQVVGAPSDGRPAQQKTAAEWAYERIVMYIQKFEETLDANHEVGMGFVGGDVGSLRIQGMGYFAPDIITFYGQAPDGSKTQLVQHVTQLNVMLVAAPKENSAVAPQRIGFKLANELQNKPDKIQDI